MGVMCKSTGKSAFAALLISMGFVASARDLTNRAFGFKMSIPESFQEIAVGANEPDTLCKFANGNPNPTSPPRAIQVQPLRGTINANQRLKLDQLPKLNGLSTTLEETT